MNTTDTVEAIKVMQAYVDGKNIECAQVEKLIWGPTHSPVWNWNNFTYRIKPLPRVESAAESLAHYFATHRSKF